LKPIHNTNYATLILTEKLVLNGKTYRKALNPSAIRAGLTLILTEKLVLNGKTCRKALNPSAIKTGATSLILTKKTSFKRENLSKGTKSISDKSWCCTNFNKKPVLNGQTCRKALIHQRKKLVLPKREKWSKDTKSISDKSWRYTNFNRKTSSKRENLSKGSKSISDKSWSYTNFNRKTNS
jgi:hypothetical protein